MLLFTSKPPVTREEAERQAKAQGRRFVCFPPGLYDQAAIDSITNFFPPSSFLLPPSSSIGSNLVIYLAPGSYFTGTFAIDDAHDVSILGRGIARPDDGYEGCHVYRSQRVLIEGLTLCTCPVGASDGVTIRDVRSISHPAWGDGLNVFASSNVLYDRVFCRNSDDCTTAYATRKGFSGNARNIRMRNATLWADVAHPIFIGLHGNPEVGDTIENLVYENIDILCQAEQQVDYQGCLAINCGDDNLVRNVRFDNIRIERILQGSILQVKVGYNQKYCTAPGRGVHDVLFRNVRYTPRLALPHAGGDHAGGDLQSTPSPYAGGDLQSPTASLVEESPTLSVINGYSEQRKVSNVRFENLRVNGRTLYDDMPGKPKWYATADYVPMYVGNHVEGITFQPFSSAVSGKSSSFAGQK